MLNCVIAALYQFTVVNDCAALQQRLLSESLELGLKGTILIATEGINGTVAGNRASIDRLRSSLLKLGFNQLEYKESFTQELPFYRMKVKIKPEIVTMGCPDIDAINEAGTYIEPDQWNELILDPEVLVIDTRNHYETEVGSFVDAESANTEHFRQFPDYANQHIDPKQVSKVAMFCTGGIRCEKATAYVRSLGVKEVYHLKGGILNYLQQISKEESLWQGECFVFDNRVTVDQDLEVGQYDLCHGCRRPITQADKDSNLYVKGVSCSKCAEHLTTDQKDRFAERQKQIELAKQKNLKHLGFNPRLVL